MKTLPWEMKAFHPWVSNFTCGMIRLQSFKMRKFSLVENPRCPPVLNIAKPLKSTFSPENLAEILQVSLVGPWCLKISK